jgi:hypothetical protein
MSDPQLPLSPEYRQLLREVVHCLLQASRDPRLPNLSPEQAHYWLTNLPLSQVEVAFRELEAESVSSSPERCHAERSGNQPGANSRTFDDDRQVARGSSHRTRSG